MGLFDFFKSKEQNLVPQKQNLVPKERDLFEDLDFYANEFYTKKDLKAGIRLLQESAGMIMVGGALISTLTITMPALGIPVSSAVVVNIIRSVAITYARCTSSERKQIRAAIKWISGGFNLVDNLID
jgi:hypothetical protein